MIRPAHRAFFALAVAVTFASAPAAQAAPTLVDVSPSSGPTSGGAIITLSGSGFEPSGNAVRLDSSDCQVSSESTIEILCTLPSGVGANLSFQVFSGGVPSNTLPFSYTPPSISSLDPASAPAAGGTLLTIHGDNFGRSQGSATVDGNDCPIQSQDHTAVECVVPPGSGTGVAVQVVVAGQSSNAASFDYTDDPVIDTLTPSHGPTAGGVRLTIRGQNFGVSGNSVTVGSSQCPTDTESSTQIECTLPEGTGTAKQVQVVEPTGLASEPVSFDYDPPSVASVDPGSGPTQGGTLITISGDNFGSSSASSLRSTTVGSSTCDEVSGDHTRLLCTLPEGQGAGMPVVVTVDGQSSNSGQFSYSPPSLDSVTPSSGSTSGGRLITLRGTSFGLSASATVGGSDCPLSSQSHVELLCTLPPGSGAGVPVVVTVAGQTSNSQSFDYVAPVCGDGLGDPVEECDDANTDDYDGCSAACELERQQSKDQQACIVALNKAGAKLAKTRAKDAATCMKASAKGKSSDPAACITTDEKGKVQKARDKTTQAAGKKCGELPDFGPDDATGVNDAATSEVDALLVDIFGSDLNAALVPGPGEEGEAACQAAVKKAYDKYQDTALKEFGKCKKAGLKGGTILASSELQRCLDEVAADAAGRWYKKRKFAEEELQQRCAEVDLGAALPGQCGAAADVASCLADLVECRVCRMLDAMDGVAEDCDLYDDGSGNGSCPQ